MRQIIYIANSKAQNIEVWNLCKDGKIKLLQTVFTNGQVQPMQIYRNKNLLYAGIRPDNKIITYHIDKNGLLCKIEETHVSSSLNYISIDRTKKILFCSSYHSNCLIVIKLNKEGIPIYPLQIIHDIQGCHAAKINKKYNVLFVTALKEDRIYLYYVPDSGILRSTEQKYVSTQKGSGPRHIEFHCNHDVSYTINELNGTIDVWKIFRDKDITNIEHIQNISLLNNVLSTNSWASDIHISSCGRFLYAADRFFHTISLFYINQNNNRLTLIAEYPNNHQARSFCLNADNTHLIAASESFNKIIIYKIDNNTGKLQFIKKYHTSERPLWVLVHQLS